MVELRPLYAIKNLLKFFSLQTYKFRPFFPVMMALFFLIASFSTLIHAGTPPSPHNEYRISTSPSIPTELGSL